MAETLRSLQVDLSRSPTRLAEIFRTSNWIGEYVVVQKMVALDVAIDSDRRTVVVRAFRLFLACDQIDAIARGEWPRPTI
jgi:hypothetical protein